MEFGKKIKKGDGFIERGCLKKGDGTNFLHTIHRIHVLVKST